MGKCNFLLFGCVLSALLCGCIYPDIHLTRYDLSKKEGGVTVRFRFVLEEGLGDSTPTVLPGAVTTPVAYKVSVTPSTAGSPAQSVYVRTADGTAEGISLPAADALTVDVRAYSVWADDTPEPLEADCILQKTNIAFTAQDVTGGVLQIHLNWLHDAVSTADGGINLTLAWPAGLDFEEVIGGVQGVTKVAAQLLLIDGTPILYPPTLQEIAAGSFDTEGAQTTAAVVYTGVPAGSYKLRLTFYRGGSGVSPAGYFTEEVSVWPGSTADTWIDAAGVPHDRRIFTHDDFYEAAASVHSITITHNGMPLAQSMVGGDDTNYVVTAGINTGDLVQFKVQFDEDAPLPSGKLLKSVKYYANDAAAVETPEADFLYETVPGFGSYTASFTLTVPSGTSTLYKAAVSVKAPTPNTAVKTYIYTFAAAARDSVRYPTLGGAVAAASGTPEHLDEVAVLTNITIKSGNNLTISSGKYIKLSSESGALVLKRDSGNTGSPLITVNGGGQLTLKNIILDGGAVWTGATPPAGGQPSPAFGADNDSLAGGIAATRPLISLEGTGTKLMLSVDSILRNNDNTSSVIETTGGAINAWYGPEVVIEGGEVRSNRTYWLGGGIALFGTGAQRTTLKLVSGSINNNDVVQHDGGGISSEGANIEIHGGFITQNRAHNYGGGLQSWKGGGTQNTLTITGGEITGNTADMSGGGGLIASAGLTVTMSGGLISGNTAPSGGGVLIDAGTESSDVIFTMSGDALIKQNTAAVTGKGVAVKTNASFTMSGGARVEPDNNVYLASGKTIAIGGDLSGTAPVATITPQNLSGGTQVVSGDAPYLTPANIAKFAISAGGWTIGDTADEKGKIYANRTASRVVSGTTIYYGTLTDALAAAGGTSSSPDVITVLADINMASSGDNLYISNPKHIKLISSGVRRIIKRGSGNEWNPLFTVQANARLTLENIIIDGGAVWADGNLPAGEPPSPAFGATNTGQNAINAQKHLIRVTGTNAKLTLSTNAVLRNNCITNTSGNNIGGAINASGGAQVEVNGAGAEVCYNQTYWTGGGIGLLDNSPQGTKLTLINGSIHNNYVVHSGGGLTSEYGQIEIQGGDIYKNHALENAGAINIWGNAGTTLTISGGSITGNIADQSTGGIDASQNAHVTMSGGSISGNISTAGTFNSITFPAHVGISVLGNAAFTMSGSAQVNTNNLVFLGTGRTIAVGSFNIAGPLAKIKPANAVAGTQILSGDSGHINANHSNFQLDSSVIGVTIGSNGYLQTQ